MLIDCHVHLLPRRRLAGLMKWMHGHPAGSGTLVEIYQTMDRVGLGESVRERLVGGTAERFVKTFWPDFDSRAAKARRAESA